MNYDASIKTSRMQAVADQIDAGAGAGKMEIGDAGFATVLASVTLNDPSGTVSTDTLTLSGFAKTVAAAASGKPALARLRDSDDNDRVTNLSVGYDMTGMQAWAGSTAYSVDDIRQNGSDIYICTGPGTSASSGGPTGQGTAISDGTATWDWLSVANADVQLDSMDITIGQNITINSVAIQHAA